MKQGFLFTVGCAVIAFSQATFAVESRLSGAAILPEVNQKAEEELSFLEASTIGSTLLERIAGEVFQQELQEREARIQALPKKKRDALEEFRRSLIAEGFDAFDILSEQTTPRYDKHLRNSVCVVLQSKSSKKNGRAALLSTRLNDAKSTAAAFGLAKLLQSFRVTTETPLWVCAQAGSHEASTRELLGKGKPSTAFLTRLVLEGTDSKAYVNFLGREKTRIVLKDRSWRWLEKDANAAEDAAKNLAKNLTRLKSSWDTDKRSPWTKTTVSSVHCEKSLISSIRSTCHIDVTVTSRSRLALAAKTEAVVSASLKSVRDFNQSLKSPKGKPAVTLLLPKNISQPAFAGPLEELPILTAWRAALGKVPEKETYISSRFIDSEFAATAADAVPTVVIAARGKTHEETTARLTTLAKTLLLFLNAHVQ